MRPELVRLQSLLESFMDGRDPIRVLEAGCGSYPLSVDLLSSAHIVGIDISGRQLERNSFIDEKVLGDIQTHPFSENDFDLIFSWDVLEHLDRPDRALANFERALRPGGLVVIKVPNVLSVKGLVTKMSPHSFHVWVYRHLFKYPALTGKDDKGPFPTFLRLSMSPPALTRFARHNGMQIAYTAIYEEETQLRLRQRIGLDGRLWGWLCRAVERLTWCTIRLDGTELLIVLRSAPAHGREEAPSARQSSDAPERWPP